MLKDDIDQFYRDSFNGAERSYFYISDAGKCQRALYFQFKNAPRQEPSPRILRVFDEGDYVHMRLMSVLFSLGIVRASEVKIPPIELIHGRADAIIEQEKELYVVEIKSSSGFKFRTLKKPQSDHVKQIQLYMHYFNIPHGIVLYENKDTQDLKEFAVSYDPPLIQKLLKDFAILKEQIEKDVIPSIPEEVENWRCRWCEYRHECKRVEELKTENPNP
jgi:CRISPR-associated protein Cas4